MTTDLSRGAAVGAQIATVPIAPAEPDDSLRPEEFAEAASAAIVDALDREVRDAARVLAEAGLLGVCADEDSGGLGLGVAYALPIASAAGRLLPRFPLVEQMLLAKAFSGCEPAAALSAGEKLATIAWQGTRAEGVAGYAAHAADCDWVLVQDDDGAVLLEVAQTTLEADPALDPECPQYWLTLAGATVVARLDAAAYAQMLADARVLLAGFVHGAAEAALERTAEYTSTRVQFGRPLTAKQAVRHWLARMRLVQEASGAAIRRTLSTDEFGRSRQAEPALAGAIENAVFVIEKAIHLHGGMGFTWELPLHRALREVRKLDAALGSGRLFCTLGLAYIQAA